MPYNDELNEELEEEKKKKQKNAEYTYNPVDFTNYDVFARYTANEDANTQVKQDTVTEENANSAENNYTINYGELPEEEVSTPRFEPEVYEDEQAEEEPVIQRAEPEVYGDDEKPYDEQEGVPYPFTDEANDQLDLVYEIAEDRFQDFLAKEREDLKPALEAIKKEHEKDYDKYMNKIRKSRYYKKRLAYWRNYYAEKKSQFAQDAAKDLLKDVDADAKNEASKSVKTAKINPVQKVATKAKNNQVVSKPKENGTVKLKLVADKDLKNTIEQILLTQLYDAIDENRDFYANERNIVEESKKIRPEWKATISTRADFADALVQSYSKVINTQDNRTVKEPSTLTIREMRKDIEAKKEKRNIRSVADVVMDGIYHVDLKTKEATGAIPELAEKLAIEVQEKLIQGNIPGFNRSKEEVVKLLNSIAKDVNLAGTISKDNENNVLLTKKRKELIKTANNVQKYIINNNEQLVSARDIDTYINDLHAYKVNANAADDIACDELIASAKIIQNALIEAKKLKQNPTENAEEKRANLIENLETQKSYLKTGFNAERLADIKSNERFKKNNLSVKKTGTRALIDKLLMDTTIRVGAARSLGKIEEFEYTETDAKAEVENLENYFNKNGNISLVVTVDLLTEMLYKVHDIREKVKGDEEKVQKAQDLLDGITFMTDYIEQNQGAELPEDIQKEIAELFNQYIEVTAFRKKGEMRQKDADEEGKKFISEL